MYKITINETEHITDRPHWVRQIREQWIINSAEANAQGIQYPALSGVFYQIDGLPEMVGDFELAFVERVEPEALAPPEPEPDRLAALEGDVAALTGRVGEVEAAVGIESGAGAASRK